MEENLVIVESPAKAKTIEKFLGKDFIVKSSFGHIRDLKKKDFGIDIKNNYEPQYEVSADKKKIVTELRKLAKSATTVWLASDEDREGEAIAWHLAEELKLKKANTKRIVFHEITKNAIQNAVKSPRQIDTDLVNAQQARRILDRLVGFELSPILWKKVKPSLSAGRVQSVAVRLVVEREREITAFKVKSVYKISAIFDVVDNKSDKTELKAELSTKFKTKDEAIAFLNKCKGADYTIGNIIKKPAKKSAAAPFTTSTLQQEASRKLGFSVSQTMRVAQSLYEAGKITYMRTDSLNLSNDAIEAAKNQIIENYGKEYSNPKKFKSKIKGAQEAHEAIRPTYLENETLPKSANAGEQKLYELIWKRTIASQMSDAKLEKTTATIDISTTSEQFVATGEILKFDGFLKVYLESTDDEKESRSGYKDTLLPAININDKLPLRHIVATERFSQRPARFTEASLVKKLEELGIGRPSTYAPIISTIQQRGYVVKEVNEGEKRMYDVITLKFDKVTEDVNSEITGAEKNKMSPTDIGMVVNDFLVANFEKVLNYNFTATVEKEFDDIAEGNRIWNDMIDKFYKPFHLKVEDTLENSEHSNGERQLGLDPTTKKPVFVRIGRYGPMAQLGESNTENKDAEKPKFASLRKGQRLETITLEETIDLFKLPRTVGKYEDKVVVIGIGRFGPYVRHDAKFVSIKEDDPLTIELDRSIVLIEEKREADRKKLIKEFKQDAELKILNGRWGPYISHNKENYKIPKTTDAEKLSFDDCMKIIADTPAKAKGKAGAKTTKKTTAKTETKAKKTTKAKSKAAPKSKTTAKKTSKTK